jgi:hypothetical protein
MGVPPVSLQLFWKCYSLPKYFEKCLGYLSLLRVSPTAWTEPVQELGLISMGIYAQGLGI